MRKMYLSAPLPFVGQKRRFAKEFIKALDMFSESAVFVDLFGGSGFLSHITKYCRPDATVVYNDFDNYCKRIENIPKTNALLADLRHIAEGIPKEKIITGQMRDEVFARIEKEEKEHGYVDYITLSSSILFSMNYKLSLEEMKKETLYNSIRTTDFSACEDYLSGLTITRRDYKDLFNHYKDIPGVVFLVDPPYLSTDASTYTTYWRIAQHLNVLNILKDHSFVYFTSNKSHILELCDWLSQNASIDLFRGCRRVEREVYMNHISRYTDIMLCKKSSKVLETVT